MKKLFLLLLGLMAAASAHALVPADPTNLTWYDCGDESGHSYLTFTLPTVDVNGTPLDIEMMGYRIYTDDDQIFTFNSALYENIFGSSTEVYYYSWEAGSDLQSNGVFFYRTNADGFERFFNTRIGVQVFYVNDNFSIGGVSNIVYTYLEDPVTELPKPYRPSVDYWEEWGTFMEELSFNMGTDLDGNPVADDYPGKAAQAVAEQNGETLEYTLLDPDKVTYSIYTDDDQIFVFTPEEFPNDVEEPTTEIPFGYAGIKMDASYCIYFEDRPAVNVETDRFFNWRIGVQMNYTVDGVKSSSDIRYLEVFPQMHEADQVTSTSFLADWSSTANSMQQSGFVGYDLYVINKNDPEDKVVVTDIPSLVNDEGEEIAGGTYLVEGLTPGATYEYYVVAKHHFGSSTTRDIQSVVREVTLPAEGHGYDLGDVNHDHKVAIDDVTFLIDYLLGSDNDICPICANVNGDNGITIADVTALIDILLSGN